MDSAAAAGVPVGPSAGRAGGKGARRASNPQGTADDQTAASREKRFFASGLFPSDKYRQYIRVAQQPAAEKDESTASNAGDASGVRGIPPKKGRTPCGMRPLQREQTVSTPSARDACSRCNATWRSPPQRRTVRRPRQGTTSGARCSAPPSARNSRNFDQSGSFESSTNGFLPCSSSSGL